MTDNGSCYRVFQRTCSQLGIKHIRSKPFTPQTNGKAERFILTALRMGLRHHLRALRSAPQGECALDSQIVSCADDPSPEYNNTHTTANTTAICLSRDDRVTFSVAHHIRCL